MSIRSLSRILRQFDNTLNRVGRDMMMREGGRVPSAIAPIARMMTPLAGSQDRDLLSPFADLGPDLMPEWTLGSRVMPLDVIEKDQEYLVSIDIPSGLNKDDVTVEKSKRDHTITVTAERSMEDTTKDDYYCIKERAWGVMKRVINVPENVDIDNVSVKFDSGILKLRLPKAEPSLPAQEKLAIED